jgi:hypothetical protein
MPQPLLAPNVALTQPPGPAECVSTPAVDSEHIDRVIGRIQNELQSLVLERAAIVKRIRVIKLTIAGLADVFGAGITDTDEELRDLLSTRPARNGDHVHPGLTDECRRTLMEFSHPLTTRQLCGRIAEANPSALARHKHPTNSLTVVLRRLVSYGEVEALVNENEVRTWLWIGPRKPDEVVVHNSPSSLLKREQGRS